MRQLLLIDGKNFAYRVHYTHRNLSSKGRSTSVLYGCLSGLISISRKLPDVPIALVWEGSGKTWRHEALKNRFKKMDLSKEKEIVIPEVKKEPVAPAKPLSALDLMKSSMMYKQSVVTQDDAKAAPRQKVEGYKAQRPVTNDRESVSQQVETLQKILTQIGIRNFKVKNLEADDLIGILATSAINKNLFDRVIIMSSDKDFYQLMSDEVKIWKPDRTKSDVNLLTPEDVTNKFGVTTAQWTKLRALTGDSSDNIPQVFAGVGPVRAAKMIQEGLDPSFPEFENHPPSVKSKFLHLAANWPMVYQNYQLSRIVRKANNKNLPEDVKANLFAMTENMDRRSFKRDTRQITSENFKKLQAFLADYEMTDLLMRADALWALP